MPSSREVAEGGELLRLAIAEPAKAWDLALVRWLRPPRTHGPCRSLSHAQGVVLRDQGRTG